MEGSKKFLGRSGGSVWELSISIFGVYRSQEAGLFFWETVFMEIEIHSTAIVADGVELGAGCTVGPYAIIESGAKIGEESEISAGCHIFGGVTMGKRNRLMRAASLGGEPQSH